MAEKEERERVSEEILKKNLKETPPKTQKEINGRSGLDPTRYGDWEKSGRCIDF